jgi:hypothetical protein
MAGLLLPALVARAYPVGPALSLGELTEEADVIFKGTAVSSQPVQDEWFQRYPDFTAWETRFSVVSVIKGRSPGKAVAFRHYDLSPEPRRPMFQPQYYHFDAGQTCIVFARHSAKDGVLRQLWMNHKIKEDQGVLLCADSTPPAGATVEEAVWAELTAMVSGADGDKALYAVRQLDEMSGGDGILGALHDFERRDVVEQVRGLMRHPDPAVAEAAIRLVGTHNPYMSDERALHWLVTVGSARVPGIGKMDPQMRNVGGQMCSDELVALADSAVPEETRALSIRALGLVRDPALRESTARWLTDPAPAVRASAALLLADFPGGDMRLSLATLADDPAAEVRACAARSAGFAQQAEMADVLAGLLADRERRVREAAAMSLLSFSPRDERIAAVFRANLDNREFEPLFLNALARENPVDYLDGLAEAVEQDLEPEHFWGGQIPAFTAWEILFRYLQGLPAENLKSGELDQYLDAMEKVGNYSSSEPRDIYAFYLQRGMTGRAAKFRREAVAAASYDLDYYFDMVDENPGLYTRSMRPYEM